MTVQVRIRIRNPLANPPIREVSAELAGVPRIGEHVVIQGNVHRVFAIAWTDTESVETKDGFSRSYPEHGTMEPLALVTVSPWPSLDEALAERSRERFDPGPLKTLLREVLKAERENTAVILDRLVNTLVSDNVDAARVLSRIVWAIRGSR